MDDRHDRDPGAELDAPLTDPEHPGGLAPGAALGAQQAPIGRDDTAREAQRIAEREATTEDLADEIRERMAGRSQHA